MSRPQTNPRIREITEMFAKLLGYYNQLDQTTIDLLMRFLAKGVSTGNLNNYLKRVLTRELEERVSVEVVSLEETKGP